MHKIRILKLVLIFSVFIGIFGVISPSKKASANMFNNCALTGVQCLDKKVRLTGQSGASSWVESVNATPSSSVDFLVGFDNRTATPLTNVVIRDVLPAGLTWDGVTFTRFDSNGATNIDGTTFFTTGLNLGTINPGSTNSVQFGFRANVSPTMAPGNYSFVNTSIVTADGGVNIQDTASVNVSYVVPVDSGLVGRYYNNSSLEGTHLVERVDNIIDSTSNEMQWSLLGSPAAGINNDRFSVRWTGQVNTQYAGNYTFYTKSDDGIRVWIDNNLVIDSWVDRGSANLFDDSVTINMTPGWHNIRIEYYENTGGATVRLFWNNANQTNNNVEIIPQQSLRQTFTGTIDITGLRGEYYDNREMQGSPVVTKTDSSVYFIYGTNAPTGGVPADNFSVKWTGRIYADFAENYTFCMQTDDGSRMWVNGNIVFDDWRIAGYLHESCGTVSMSAGWNTVRLDMFEYTGHNAAILRWSSASQTSGNLVNIPTNKLSPTGGPNISVGLLGEYFNNIDLTGTADLTRNDSNIYFDWYLSSPDLAINQDNFSARWTGYMNLTENGNYSFITYSDNGARVWIDDVLVIDNWNWSLGSRRAQSSAVNLIPGYHSIRVEYFDSGDAAGIQLFWTTPSNASESVVPSARLTN